MILSRSKSGESGRSLPGAAERRLHQLEVRKALRLDSSVSSLGSPFHESRNKRLHGRDTFWLAPSFFFFAGVIVPD